ncbi:phage BR0599 family protein [Agrobacterium tumefaciens]|uniref:phage BR0599 family protein n=1 Tax=Agrobacterium tumefaciens TaxID=358 RepID=UPI0016594B82|nr:phage BR0599 family protein [Agrobacterium tumefaciens]QNP78415.1 phage BR0599 family protein [Agrobacterium tumefaciens]
MSFDQRENSRYSGTPVSLYLIQGAENSDEGGNIGPFGFNNGEEIINRKIGVNDLGQDIILPFYPWPIKNSAITHDGTLDKSDVTISMSLGSEIDQLFLAYPPSQVVNLTIFEGHVGDPVTEENYPAIWLGRILGSTYKKNELELSCQPVSTSLKRPGLRRNYQIGCPHVLYGSQCRASRAAATVARSVGSVTRNRVMVDGWLGAQFGLYVGGLLEWINSDTGVRELRTIANVLNDSGTSVIVIRGIARGLAAGTQLSVIRGCNRQMSGCNQHNNIQNYGGQPFIPLENPLSSKNQFY